VKIEPIENYRRAASDKFGREVIVQSGGNLAFVLHFLPGQKLPAHRHPGARVVLAVLEGSGTACADGAAREIKAGDIIRTGGDELFSVKNTGGGPLTIFVTLIRDQEQADEISAQGRTPAPRRGHGDEI